MNCTGKRCLAQYNKVDPATCTAVSYCPQATPPKTNADRIRNMSDKDLADLLSGGEPYPWCEQDPCPAETCQECILMWLKQEAKHDL